MIRRALFGVVGAAALALLAALPVAALDPSPSPPGSPPPSPASAASPSAFDEGGRDQVSFGSDIHLAAGETVRDVVCIGCSVFSQGIIARDLVVVGGNADILGPVGRDAVDVGGYLHLGPKASVGRDLTAVGGGSSVDPGAAVGRNRTGVGWPGTGGLDLSGFGGGPGGLFPSAVMVLLAVLAMAVFPRQLAVTAALVEARPIASFGLGCFGIIAAIAIAILCAITVILLPVTLLLTLATLAAWVFGWAGVYLVAGRRLLAAADRRVQPLLAVVVGGALFALLALVPLVGIPLGLLGGSIALGGALGSRFGTRIEQGDFFAWGHPPAPAAMVSPAPHPPPFEDPPGGNT